VTRALVIAGDAGPPAGPYPSSLELLRTGLFQEHGLHRIGLACYPEPHRKIGPRALDEALAAKLDLVRETGLEAWLVSQFCFEAAPIIRRAEALRAQGIATALRVGLAGPADRRTLWKYALHCGIGNSIRALGTRVGAVANLLSRRAPDGLLADIAAARCRNLGLGIEGVHIFTFGGVASAASWANALLTASEAPGR
jgi:methylenetetrahydrofolate reductase (NADPH)